MEFFSARKIMYRQSLSLKYFGIKCLNSEAFAQPFPIICLFADMISELFPPFLLPICYVAPVQLD